MNNFSRYAATAGRYGTIGKGDTAKGLGIPWKNISLKPVGDMFPTVAAQIVSPNKCKGFILVRTNKKKLEPANISGDRWGR
jgi:hypothetical protein